MVVATQTETPPASIERDEPDHEYHARSEVGASMLEEFRRRRQSYRTLYVDHTATPPAPTPAMQFGTLVHLRVLAPALFAERVAEPLPEIAPDGKKWLRRKGSDHERWWQEELDRRAGKIAADQGTLARVNAAAAAIKRNPIVARMLDDGEGEVSHYWTDQETGLRCKCRVDWLAGGFALDIKTTPDASPAAFSRRVVQLGYHRKLAHYADGLLACHGERVPLVHVAVEPEWPHRVGVYELDDTDRDGAALGRQQRRELLRELAECLNRDDWSEPWERQVTALRLPGWAWNDDAYTLGGDDGCDSDD